MNIYDVAREAGVSIATVSRVINGKSVVSEKTRKRVEEVLKAHNYSPSEIARGLVVNSIRTVGILTVDIRDIYYATVAYILEQELSALGYTVILCNTGDDNREKVKYLKTLKQKKVDSVILVGSVFKDAGLERSIVEMSEKIPIVMVNGFIEARNIYAVLCDDRAGIQEAVEYLLSQGRKNPIYLQDTVTYSAEAKVDGFRMGMAKQNKAMDPSNLIKVEKGLDGAQEGIERAIEKGVSFDAVVCGDDITAVGVINALARRGIRVPEEVAVVGFNNSILARCCQPAITSVDSRMEDMGKRAVDLFHKVMAGEKMPARMVLQPRLHIREST